MGLSKPIMYAVIHVGSSNMSFSIVELTDLDHIKTIEIASRDVTYGEELFQTKRLSFRTIREMCTVLKGYAELMKTYGVTEYSAVATSVIREAKNKRNILDQIYVQTGFEVQVLDMPREIYLKYFALYRNIRTLGLTEQDEGVLFLDVTSGGLGLAVWQNGNLMYQQNLHIGTVRVLESFSRQQRASMTFSNAMEEYLHSLLRPIVRELYRFSIKYLVLSGEEARRIAEMMGVSSQYDNVIIEPQKFLDFYSTFDGITALKLVNRFKMPENRANIIMPLLIIYHEILSLVSVKSVFINNTTFREGLVLYYGAEFTNSAYLEEVRFQTLQLARSIAARFQYDIEHSELIECFGDKIFEAIAPQSGLSERSAFILKMTAILHGIGRHISLRNHSELSYSMIRGSDIFGISESEKQVVAAVSYYNYMGGLTDADPHFSDLTEAQKMLTIKLTAIFRLARALNQAHLQKINDIDVTLHSGKLKIVAISDKDLSLERWILMKEIVFFEQVFGISVVFEQRR